VLIGTDSVATADALSQALWSAGLAHQLLTARDDQREAALIANAGAPGTLTVATNIAGRGTDILLPPATLDAGGLHVICCTQNASPRIDRQLLGRAARNGQPGSTERIVSIDDPAFADLLPKTLLRWLKKRANKAGFIPYWTGVILSRMVQALKVCGQFMYSWQLVRHDKLLRESIAPAAQIE
jgi:preprotein translocase subunit SecA